MAEPDEIRVIPNDYQYYKPLDKSKEEIRLLRIEPSESPKGPLVCHLYRADLDNAPPYTALSYAWGSLEDTLEITLVFHESSYVVPIMEDQWGEVLAGSPLSNGFPNSDAPGGLVATGPRDHTGFDDDTHLNSSTCHYHGAGAVPAGLTGDGAQTRSVPAFRITQGLHAGLRSLRLQESPHTLVWADMLCLNQSDKSERSHQVQRMDRIFSGATKVIVWLGGDPETPSDLFLESDDSLRTFTDLLDCTNEQVHRISGLQIGMLEGLLSPGQMRSNMEAIISQASQPGRCSGGRDWSSESTYPVDVILAILCARLEDPLDRFAYLGRLLDPETCVWRFYQQVVGIVAGERCGQFVSDAVRKYTPRSKTDIISDLGVLFQLPWFGRVWVLQEVALNERVYARHGKSTIDWDIVVTRGRMFSVGCEHLLEGITSQSDVSLMEKTMRWYDVARLWSSNDVRQGLSACNLLKLTSSLGATVPRDKLYAIYHLANDIQHAAFTPDYHQSQHESYTEFTRCVITTTKNLLILSLLNGSTKSTGPSWVPQYDDLRMKSGVSLRCTDYNPFRASRCRVTRHIRTSGKELIVLQGTHVANIQYCITLGKSLSFRGYWNLLNPFYRHVVSPSKAPAVTEQGACGFSVVALSYLLVSIMLLDNGMSSNFEDARTLDQCRSNIIAFLCREKAAGLFLDNLSVADLFVMRRNGWQEAYRGNPKWGPRGGIFFTPDGTVGYCTGRIRHGDKVVALDGGSVLYILRKRPTPNMHESTRAEAARRGMEFELVGECFLHGHMDGKIFEEPSWYENDPLYLDPIDYDPAMETPGGKCFTNGFYRRRPFVIT